MKYKGSEMRGNGFTKPPLCPFCSAPWTEDMIELEGGASEQYESVGPECYGAVKITCEACDRLIYEKEFG